MMKPLSPRPTGAQEPPIIGGKSTLRYTISGAADAEATRRAKLAQIGPKYRATFQRAWAGKSRKAAIRAFCIECMGYTAAEVPRCTSPACPLYPYREGGA